LQLKIFGGLFVSSGVQTQRSSCISLFPLGALFQNYTMLPECIWKFFVVCLFNQGVGLKDHLEHPFGGFIGKTSVWFVRTGSFGDFW